MKRIKQRITSWLRKQLDKIGQETIDTKTDEEIIKIVQQIKVRN